MQSSNLLLASLSAGDTAALQPFLKPFRLEHKQILYLAGETIEVVYYPSFDKGVARTRSLSTRLTESTWHSRSSSCALTQWRERSIASCEPEDDEFDRTVRD